VTEHLWTASAISGNVRSVSQHIFRGSLVTSRWVNGPFWDKVEVARDRLVLHPKARPRQAILRGDVMAIEFEKMRLPLVWTTNVYFRLSDGSRAPRLFTPWRPRAFRSCLADRGWPIIDCPSVSLRRNRSDSTELTT